MTITIGLHYRWTSIPAPCCGPNYRQLSGNAPPAKAPQQHVTTKNGGHDCSSLKFSRCNQKEEYFFVFQMMYMYQNCFVKNSHLQARYLQIYTSSCACIQILGWVHKPNNMINLLRAGSCVHVRGRIYSSGELRTFIFRHFLLRPGLDPLN